MAKTTNTNFDAIRSELARIAALLGAVKQVETSNIATAEIRGILGALDHLFKGAR